MKLAAAARPAKLDVRSLVLSATLLARADAPRAGASLWGGAVLVSAGVIAFATSPPPMKERRKAHVSDPIPEEEA